jgi:hypothetical protein
MLDVKGNRITYFGHSAFSLTTPTGQVAAKIRAADTEPYSLFLDAGENLTWKENGPEETPAHLKDYAP